MVEARQRDNWTHTSSILALTANCNRDPKKRALKPDDFNPYSGNNKARKNADLSEIKAILMRTFKN